MALGQIRVSLSALEDEGRRTEGNEYGSLKAHREIVREAALHLSKILEGGHLEPKVIAEVQSRLRSLDQAARPYIDLD